MHGRELRYTKIYGTEGSLVPLPVKRGCMQALNRETIYRQVIDAISRDNTTVLDQFLSEQLLDHNPIPGQSPGRKGFKEWMAFARVSFPDLRGIVEDILLGEDGRLMGRVT